MRLVPHQNPNKIEKLFKKYIKQIAPKEVSVKVTGLHGGYPVITLLDDKATIAGAKAMQLAFGKKTVYMREGGSIPIVVEFANRLKSITSSDGSWIKYRKSYILQMSILILSIFSWESKVQHTFWMNFQNNCFILRLI